MDRIKYEVCYRLWHLWHIRLRRFFDGFTPTRYGLGGFPYAKFITEPRPWWHMCCNGDSGGWRTAICDYFEYAWRGTDYYNREN